MGAILDGLVPPLIVAIRTKPGELFSTLDEANKKIDELDRNSEQKMSHAQRAAFTMAEIGKKALFGLATAAFTGAAASAKLAGDYQEATTQLVTGAGESEKNLEMVRQGLLKMAPAVGQGPVALAKGMYMVESAGYHGAQGLKVMQAAAEGATVGATDTATVADALTTVLTDYHLPAQKAADVTSKLVATVASGKTTMGDLAAAIHNVAPQAASAGVSLEQMLGALATMTGQGIDAAQATQDLKNTIQSLQNMTPEQTKEMEALGLSAKDVELNVGRRGLTGTLSLLEGALAKHMHLGQVWLSTYQHLTEQTDKLNMMVGALPVSLRPLGEAIAKGTISSKQMRHEVMGLSIAQKQLIMQVESAAARSRGFNTVLTNGGASAQTFGAALAKLTGGATGMNVALALGGKNTATFNANVHKIAATTADAHGHVKGFAEASKDFNFKLHQLSASAQVLAIEIGDKVIPVVEKIVGWLGKHKLAVKALAAVIIGFVTIAIAFYIKRMASMVKDTITGYRDLTRDGAKWVGHHAKHIGQVIADWYRSVVAREDAANAFNQANTDEVASEQTKDDQVTRLQSMMDEQRRRSAAIAQETAAQTAQANRLIAESAAATGTASTASAAEQVAATEEVGAAEDALGAESAVAGAEVGAATGGITIAIAAVGLAATYLATHWKQVWGWIKDAAGYVWRDVLKPLFGWMKEAFLGTVEGFEALGHVFVKVWDAIKDAALFVWDHALKYVFTAIKDYILFEIDVYKALWRAVVFVWDGIKTAISVVWNDVIKPVFHFIEEAIQGNIMAFQMMWHWIGQAWDGVKLAFSDAWGFIKKVFGYVEHYGIDPIVSAIKFFGQIWNDIWTGIEKVISWVWDKIEPVIHTISSAISGVSHVIGGVIHGVGSVISGIGSFLGLDTGGPVPGAVGKPVMAVVHGGEFMLSHDMLTGKAPIPGGVAAAVLGNAAKDDRTVSALAAAATPNSFTSLPGGGSIDNGSHVHGEGCTTIVVQGSVIDQAGLFRAVQTAALQHGGRNSATWAPYKRG